MPNSAVIKWATIKGFRNKIPKAFKRFYNEVRPLAVAAEKDVHPHSAFVQFRLDIPRDKLDDLDPILEENGFKCEGHYIDPDTEESVECYSQDKSAVWAVSLVDFRYLEFTEIF